MHEYGGWWMPGGVMSNNDLLEHFVGRLTAAHMVEHLEAMHSPEEANVSGMNVLVLMTRD